MKHYDLHNHTEASPDSNLEPEVLVDVAIKSELDGIAITNHGVVSGVSRARQYADDDLEIISGAEITSEDYGDILCLYIDEVPDHDGTASDIIDKTHENSGLSILAHPYAYRTVDFRGVPDKIIEKSDGIETVNSRNILEGLNKKAERLAEMHSATRTGGSDTHFYFESGRARTLIPESTTLKTAIKQGRTVAEGSGSHISSHIARVVSNIGSGLS